MEQFITSLYTLAEDCAYGELKSEIIRDRIVVGIRDCVLSEKLQLDDKLTLEKAKLYVRQKEAVHEQQTLIKTKEEVSIDFLKNSRSNFAKSKSSRPYRPQGSNKFNKSSQSTPQNCGRCGRGPHPRSQCPAGTAECHKCKKIGHYSSMCRSNKGKSVSTVEEAFQEGLYLNTVENRNNSTSWSLDIAVEGVFIPFKLDTGAEVTAISPTTLAKLGAVQLRQPSRSLHGPDRKTLNVLGNLPLNLALKDKSSQQEVYVVDKLKSNLLGLPAIKALKVAGQAPFAFEL